MLVVRFIKISFFDIKASYIYDKNIIFPIVLSALNAVGRTSILENILNATR